MVGRFFFCQFLFFILQKRKETATKQGVAVTDRLRMSNKPSRARDDVYNWLFAPWRFSILGQSNGPPLLGIFRFVGFSMRKERRQKMTE